MKCNRCGKDCENKKLSFKFTISEANSGIDKIIPLEGFLCDSCRKFIVNDFMGATFKIATDYSLDNPFNTYKLAKALGLIDENKSTFKVIDGGKE